MSQHLRISGSSARSMCPIHVLAFMSQHPCASQDPLQDPCLRIHISAAICISGSSTRSTSSDSCLSIFVSHGFSARSMSPDSYLSIHLYLRILCKIHVSGSMCPIHVLASTNMDPLQDPCLRIQISTAICISGSSTRSTSSDSCLSIFVSHRFSARSMSPDSCLSIHIYKYLRILCKIHVSGFMSQHLCISGSSTRSTSSDSCLSIFVSHGFSARSMCPIHVLASTKMDPLEDPHLRIHVSQHLSISWILCKTHVSGSMSQHPFISQDPLQDPCLRSHVSASLYLRILCKIHVSGSMSQHLYISGASARSMSPTHVLASLSSDFVALRRRNANFDLRRRVLCGPTQGKQSSRDPRQRFAQAKRNF